MDGAPSTVPRIPGWMTALPALTARVAMVLGLTVLAGWWTGADPLVRVLPSLPAMAPPTALAFLLSGIALDVLGRRARPGARAMGVARACAAATLAVALVELAHDVGWLGVPIDGLLVPGPGRHASPHTMLAFAGVGVSLLTLARRSGGSQAPSLVTALIVLAAALGYAFGVDHLRGESHAPGMALHTLLGLVVLTTGILSARPELPPARWLATDTPGAAAARGLLPVAVLVPVVLGALAVIWQRTAGHDPALAISMVVVGSVGALVWAVRVAVDRVDAAHTRIRRAEDRFDALWAQAPVGVFQADAEGAAIAVNARYTELTGLTASGAQGASWAEVIHPDDRERVFAAWAAAVADGSYLEADYRVCHPDGRVVSAIVRADAVRDEHGEVEGFLGTVTDVTARRQAEEALRAGEREYRSLAAAVPVGILRMDAHGAWTYVNGHFRALWDMAPGEDVTGFDWRARVHPDDRGRIAADWGAAMATEADYEGEFRLVGPGGEARWMWTTARCEHRDDGSVAGYLATTLDVHEARTAREALRRSEELHRLTVASLPGATVALYDRDLRCLLVEGAGAASGGMTTAACAGRRMGEFAPADVADALEPLMREALSGRPQELDFDSPITGRISRFHIGPFRDADGRVAGVLWVGQDVTEQRRAERAQREATRRFQVAFDQAPIGLTIIGLDGRMHQVNRALSNLTGHPAEDLVGREPFFMVHPDDAADIRRRFFALGRDGDRLAERFRLARTDREERLVEVRVNLIRDEDGAPQHALAQLLDVTEQHRHERELERLAEHDPLTGLLNRRGFDAALGAHVARGRRYGHRGALLVLDLDGFKAVNDALGHAAGDELIVGIARTLARRLRDSDVVARMGGDEFAVLLPEQTEDEAGLVAQTLIDAIRARAAEGDAPGIAAVTASVGVAGVGDDAADVLAAADRAMYAAKQRGKDCVAFARQT